MNPPPTPTTKTAPPLNFLRSFEVAARHLSFTAAAEELNYTQAAISNHVRSLEDHLGRPLFHRHARSLTLTEVGEAYLPAVRGALEQIDIATAGVSMSAQISQVVIACPVSLAEAWLPRQIAAYQADHPETEFVVHGTVWASIGDQVADLEITLERAEAVGRDALFEESLAMVCSPALLATGGPKSPADVATQKLVQIMGRHEYWAAFCTAHDLPEFDLSGGVRSDGSNVALEMAAAGLGCVVAQRSLAAVYIERGLLVEPFPTPMISPYTYRLTGARTTRNRAARQFAHWLISPDK